MKGKAGVTKPPRRQTRLCIGRLLYVGTVCPGVGWPCCSVFGWDGLTWWKIVVIQEWCLSHWRTCSPGIGLLMRNMLVQFSRYMGGGGASSGGMALCRGKFKFFLSWSGDLDVALVLGLQCEICGYVGY